MNNQRVKVTVSRQETYDVVIGFQTINCINNYIAQMGVESSQIFMLVDSNVADLHLDYMLSSLAGSPLNLEVVNVASGEINKSLFSYQSIIDELASRGMQRRALLLLVGGGVIMDMGGLVGATFMRGVPIINIPTTLLAQVDASIGGKVAVNHRLGKNLIGAFYNPRLVIIDPYFITTLSTSHLREGLAEAIKVAVVASEELFELIESGYQHILQKNLDIIQHLIAINVQKKSELLYEDPLEVNLERVLNFGHTLAHPLETIYEHKGLTHGEAVAIGMSAAVRYAMKNNICSSDVGNRILTLLQQVGLPTSLSRGYDQESLAMAIQTVIRIRNGAINFVVPTSVGKAIIIKDAAVADIIDCLSETG